MLQTKMYQRATADAPESLTVVASIDSDGSEIRVTHTIGESVIDDRIAYHGADGERWLDERHVSWTADGFELVYTGPEF